MRRRLREQRRVREALLLDLGALVFELHRHGRREPELLQAKSAELTQVDAEVRGLSEALDADLGVVELMAAGIAGSCQSCDALLSSDTRFCPACGAATKPGLEPQRGQPPEVPADRQVEAPTEEQAVWAEDVAGADDDPLEDEDSFDEEPELAEEVEPEPEADEPAAPWLQQDSEAEAGEEPEAEAEPEPEPAPEQPQPVKVKRPMSRLERTLRGRRKDDS